MEDVVEVEEVVEQLEQAIEELPLVAADASTMNEGVVDAAATDALANVSVDNLSILSLQSHD